jgi:DNA (cytosine-5)-methyltransferase 1
VYDIFRIADEIKPRWIFLENVPAITTRGGIEVVKEIAKMGFDCRWCVISAASVGALHKRKRWFLLAHSTSNRLQATNSPKQSDPVQPLDIYNIKSKVWGEEPESKFEVVGMVDGVQHRTHRIRALGNAVVPAQAREAFLILSGIASQKS